MKIYRFLLILFLIATFYDSQAQNWFGLSIGVNQSSLDFRNSSGQKNEDLKGVPGFTASTHFIFPLSTIKNLSLSGATVLNTELMYKSSNIVDKGSSQQSTWALGHLGSSITLRKHFSSQSSLIPFYEIGAAYDYLLSGNQTIGFEQFNVKENLNPSNFSVQGGFGLLYNISYEANASLLLGYVHGLSDIEKEALQSAKLNGLRASIAIYFTIENSGR